MFTHEPGVSWHLPPEHAAPLAHCALLVHEDLATWWLLPVAVLGLLAESLRRAKRRSG